jgi:hypothetical protein
MWRAFPRWSSSYSSDRAYCRHAVSARPRSTVGGCGSKIGFHLEQKWRPVRKRHHHGETCTACLPRRECFRATGRESYVN